MTKKLNLLVFFLFLGYGLIFSQIKVTGIVIDESDEPIIGATIQVKGEKSKGSITDIDGKFYLNPEKPDVPLNKNDAFQKVQKRHVQEKR